MCVYVGCILTESKENLQGLVSEGSSPVLAYTASPIHYQQGWYKSSYCQYFWECYMNAVQKPLVYTVAAKAFEGAKQVWEAWFP